MLDKVVFHEEQDEDSEIIPANTKCLDIIIKNDKNFNNI